MVISKPEFVKAMNEINESYAVMIKKIEKLEKEVEDLKKSKAK